MAFREISAWIMVLALLLGGAFYARAVAELSAGLGELAPPALPLVVVYTILLVAVAVVGHIAASVVAYRDAGAPADERDRRIATRASHLSSYVLGAGVVTSLGVYLLSPRGDLLFYLVFASLMLSNLAEYALQILFYRRAV